MSLLTETLQFFAIERHRRLMDVGIDMAVALLAIMMMRKRWVGASRPSVE